MKYIVLDMEWNQPYSKQDMVKNPILFHGEIIQIGAVKLDENFKIIKNFKILVKPKYYQRMHRKVEKLTHITKEQLKYGFPFPLAFKHFKRWCGDDFVFITWGSDDIEMLKENLMMHQLKDDWIPKTYNLQLLFDQQISKQYRQISLTNAMELLQVKSLEAHDALNDAQNTAVICTYLDMQKGMAEYDALEKQWKCYGNSAKESEQMITLYQSQDEALKDKDLLEFYCATYQTNVVCGDFVRQNRDKMIGIGQCENGQQLLIRYKFTRVGKEGYRVSRMIYELDEYHQSYYERMKEAFLKVKEKYLSPTTCLA